MYQSGYRGHVKPGALEVLAWALPGVVVLLLGVGLAARARRAGEATTGARRAARVGLTLVAVGVLFGATLPLVVRGQGPLGPFFFGLGLLPLWYLWARPRERES